MKIHTFKSKDSGIMAKYKNSDLIKIDLKIGNIQC